MSQLQKIYTNNQENLSSAVEEFVSAPADITGELNAFFALADSPDHEKALFIFYVEILSRVVKKEKDFVAFTSKLLRHIDTHISYKNSIFILRTIRSLLNTRFYTPLTYYLTRILELAITQKKLTRSGKIYSYEDVRLSSDDLKHEELQLFVVGETLALIRRNCIIYGSSIGFPEMAFVLCNELRRHCKVGYFKGPVSELIKWLSDRKEYIEGERSKLRVETMDGKRVAEFENGLISWIPSSE